MAGAPLVVRKSVLKLVGHVFRSLLDSRASGLNVLAGAFNGVAGSSGGGEKKSDRGESHLLVNVSWVLTADLAAHRPQRGMAAMGSIHLA